MRRHRLNGVPWTLILLFRPPSAFSPSLWSLFVSVVLLLYLTSFLCSSCYFLFAFNESSSPAEKKRKKKPDLWEKCSSSSGCLRMIAHFSCYFKEQNNNWMIIQEKIIIIECIRIQEFTCLPSQTRAIITGDPHNKIITEDPHNNSLFDGIPIFTNLIQQEIHMFLDFFANTQHRLASCYLDWLGI